MFTYRSKDDIKRIAELEAELEHCANGKADDDAMLVQYRQRIAELQADLESYASRNAADVDSIADLEAELSRLRLKASNAIPAIADAIVEIENLDGDESLTMLLRNIGADLEQATAKAKEG